MRDRAADKIWSEFQAWCRARRLRPLPAHPWTVAAYARWCETRHRLPTIVKRLDVIDAVHAARGKDSPVDSLTVSRTLRMIEIRRNRKRAKAKPLFDDAEAVAAHPPATKPKPDPKGLSSTPKLVRKKPNAG